MKIGNTSFGDNVIFRENIPTGFKVVAGGDIRVLGTVEAATLKTGLSL